MQRLSLYLVLTLAACINLPAQRASVFQTAGVAIRGYDPVAFFTTGKPMPGKKAYVLNWQNAEWLFSSQAHLDSFKLSPGRYAPQYGGYCAYGAAEGHKAPTEIDTWTIVDGKLYFNYNQKVKELWNKKRVENINKADKNWSQIKDKD